MSTRPTPLPTDDAVPAGPGRRSAELLGGVGVVGLVVGVILGLVLGGVIGLVVGGVVVGAAAPAALWWRSGRIVEPAGPDVAVGPLEQARLVNLVEGLSAASGIRVPALRVVAGPGCNLAIIGREASGATLIVTAPTLTHLSRMELEGFLAVGAAAIRRGEARPATLAAALGGLVAPRAVGAGRDTSVDRAAIAVTRYPPGLVAAYEKLIEVGTGVAGASRRGAHLWLVDPAPGEDRTAAYRTPLRQRIDALREL